MENFIVSARKYRPATFISVVGQAHITSTLKNAINRGQLAHAYLFCGPRGVGKTTCARIFAKAINCMDPAADGEACGQCESCRSFDEGRSFNIHELDAASNNSVDDIRNLTDQVRIPPQIGRYSVYIIDEVHMLSAQAFNAFLKTLEEPPAHAVFILATTEKHKIIPTILSRCQIFDFNRIKVEDGVGYMKHIAGQEGVTYDEESLNLIARKADGGMRDALSMFDKAVSFCGSDLRYKEVAKSLNILDYDTYFDAVDIIIGGDYGQALLMFDRVLGQGFSGQIFMSGLNSHLRDLLVARNDATAGLLDVTKPLLERYREQAARCTTQMLFDGIAMLTDLDARVRSATNQRLLVELALMKLCNMASPQDPEKKKYDGLAPDVGLPTLNSEKKTPPKAEVPTTDAAREGREGREQAQGQRQAHEQGQAQPQAPLQEPQVQAPPQEAQTPAPPQEPAGPEPSGTIMAARVDEAPYVAAPIPQPADAEATSREPETITAPEPAPEPERAPAATGGAAPAATGATEPRPAPVAAVPSTPLTGITGRPISEILKDKTEDTAEAEEQENVAPVDDLAQEKIERFREKFVGKLAQERPRLGVVYETMEVEANVVKVKVASQTLHDEVLRHRTETLSLLAAVAGVYGPIELEVTVDETMKAARPIKLEDKVAWLADKNPGFNELRKTLDMEIE